ncbi:Response Regulator Receiver Signal Transduction Histidine Kinase [Trichormus variabilis ATCC 29413]|uniref:histidine kinase n=2 Tax=Anabaena variabilis TaxID=264691 RepID=Q3M3Y7_TRIV2|nr:MULTISPECIES: hybrid sensor histidine kinase/response regulator [Nostocaceae]ABA24299.1 Response Regulator Receiver Signal Transduction Histidine Kinase [Trichormus variabilis ATCC 29413]MBC1214982.1 hybrid sensor histidine kinase/response regulator [Trichormus variabilis ARAD]MBC1254061.1 hybrid sensor histidine kinase/response regulator [Trichormus variabilis V5]MBC1267124.1 hybrid sensor histidine kinase/response regulator [Trichormus variabilis FSR]MBC1301903.1 hybrid sensor histidine k
MNLPSILVIDDLPDNFDVIETLLSEQDYTLHYVASGQEAIASLNLFQPDLILLDVMMPGMDGIEVCQRIKAMPQWQSVPIIMVTALTAKEDLARCLKSGADDFISKPINALELRARLHSMLRIKQQYDKIQTLSNIQTSTIKVLESTLDELRGNLAAALPHELNTPLNGIVGTISILMADIENMDTGEIQELLGWVDLSARNLERLIKQLLLYLELELSTNQQQNIASESTHFSIAVIEAILQSHAPSVNRRDDLMFAIEEAEVSISARYLAIIIYELVDNALKFSRRGTTIKISSQVVAGMLNVYIHDFGRGMTEEQISKIGAFMQFERKTYEQQGIGMGLKLAKQIIESHGGLFSISSVYKKETMVHIALPIAYSRYLS